jgi:hypothetical protein
MSLKNNNKSLLNLNDCVINTKKQCEKIVTNIGIPDVLMTQFSFSSWIGNEGDGYWNKKCADNVLKRVKLQTEELSPDYVIPFASFVKFAHEDNSWMNDWSNKLKDVVPYIKPATPIPMYIGQKWEIGEEPPEDLSELWYENKDIQIPYWDRKVAFREILREFDFYQRRIKKQNSWLAIRLLKWCGLLPSTSIYLEDNNIGIDFCIVNGIQPTQTLKDDCDVSMKTHTFINVLEYEWGRGTLTVNGRFRANYDNMWKFFRQTKIAYANNVGKRVPLTLSLRELLGKYKPFGEKIWNYTT